MQDVLVARLALAPAQLQVLNRAHEDGNTRHIAQFATQPLDHRLHRLALAGRLQADKHAPGILRATATIERTDGGHVGIGANDASGTFLQANHLGKGRVLSGFCRDLDLADVFFREETLGNDHYQPRRGDKGGRGQQHHQQAMAQGQVKHAGVARQQKIETNLKGMHQFVGWLLVRFVGQKAACQHRHQRQRDKGRDHNGQGHHHGKFVEQEANHARHEEDRNEDRNQRSRNGNDGEAHLARTAQRGLKRRHPILDVTNNVLQHDDGVVHHQTDRQRQAEQRDVVEAIGQAPEQGHGANQ